MTVRLTTTRTARDVRLVVGGSLDIATAPELRDALRDAIGDGVALVVDLEAVDFVDSSALGVLVGGLRRAREHGGDLRVVCSNREVVRIFRIAGLEERLGLIGPEPGVNQVEVGGGSGQCPRWDSNPH